MRNNYWSCSKFADWLRGTAKPYAETSEGWRDWKNNARSAHRLRYWIAEEGLDHLQRFIYYIPDQLYSVKYYINNRWITGTHRLTAHPRDIKPGAWCDVGNRFLPCLFNELVDFVELEQAWHNIAWSEEARKKYKPPFYAWGWFRWRTWRSAEAGLDALRWAAALTQDESYGLKPGDPDWGKPTHQAVNAAECINLYLWWTQVRPQRADPHDASGWTEYCEQRRTEAGDGFWLGCETDEQRRRSSDILAVCSKIEAEYEEEDEAMMIRLIKLRRYLWT